MATACTLLATGWPNRTHASVPPQGSGVRTAAASDASSGGSSPAPARASTPVAHAQTATRGAFTLTVHTSQGRLQAAVAPMAATVRANGTAEPIDPPHHTAKEWDTAAWIEQSAYPAAPSTGPSYIYGHACHYHVCPFSRLTDVAVGDTVTVRTASPALTYRVCALGLSAKSGNLVVPACPGGTAALVLVTCQYEHGDTSTSNLVVVAELMTRSS